MKLFTRSIKHFRGYRPLGWSALMGAKSGQNIPRIPHIPQAQTVKWGMRGMWGMIFPRKLSLFRPIGLALRSPGGMPLQADQCVPIRGGGGRRIR